MTRPVLPALLTALANDMASELTVIMNVAALPSLEPRDVVLVRAAMDRSAVILESLREAV